MGKMTHGVNVTTTPLTAIRDSPREVSAGRHFLLLMCLMIGQGILNACLRVTSYVRHCAVKVCSKAPWAALSPSASLAGDLVSKKAKQIGTRRQSPRGKNARTCRAAPKVGQRRVSRPGRRRSVFLKRKRDKRKERELSRGRSAEILKHQQLACILQHNVRNSEKKTATSSSTAYVSTVEDEAYSGEFNAGQGYPMEHTMRGGETILIKSILTDPSRRKSAAGSPSRVQFVDQLPKAKANKGKLPRPPPCIRRVYDL